MPLTMAAIIPIKVKAYRADSSQGRGHKAIPRATKAPTAGKAASNNDSPKAESVPGPGISRNSSPCKRAAAQAARRNSQSMTSATSFTPGVANAEELTTITPPKYRANPSLQPLTGNMNILETPNPFVPHGPEPMPPLPRLAVAARLHLSTLTWEQAEAALNPLRPLPGYAAYTIQFELKPLLTSKLPKLLQTITYWEFMLYHDIYRLNIVEQDNLPINDYLTWNSFLTGAFNPPPLPQAVPLYELPNFRKAAEQWRSRVIAARNKVRAELESIARAAAARNPAAALHRYRELEWKYQERLRRRLRDQARRPPA